jgi:DNA-binding CsgD family transcriptional regulator
VAHDVPTDTRTRLGGDIDVVLEGLGLAAWIADRTGVIRWANARARDVFGELVGRSAFDLVEPESLTTARSHWVEHSVGPASQVSFKANLRSASGRPVPVDVHSASLREGGSMVGVFGIGSVGEAKPRGLRGTLTPRQLEILGLLGDGRSTQQIADELHLTVNTVRNHVKATLHALDARSRLEAVVEGRRRGLI